MTDRLLEELHGDRLSSRPRRARSRARAAGRFAVPTLTQLRMPGKGTVRAHGIPEAPRRSAPCFLGETRKDEQIPCRSVGINSCYAPNDFVSRITIFLSVCVLVAVTASASSMRLRRFHRPPQSPRRSSRRRNRQPLNRRPRTARHPTASHPTAGGATAGRSAALNASAPAGRLRRQRCVRAVPRRSGKEHRASRHGQTKSRTPAATLGCESCHGPGQAHVDDDAKGHIKKFGALKPAEINETCLTCHNRGNHAGWEGSTHEARNLVLHDLPQRAQARVVRAPARQGRPRRSCARRAIACRSPKTERAVAHMPVREGKMSCSSCHNPHGSISNVKALKVGSSVNEMLHELSRRDARTDAVGARAGARELHDLPRSARLVERSHADRAHADALSALSRRDQASRVASTTTPRSRRTRAIGCSAGRA